MNNKKIIAIWALVILIILILPTYLLVYCPNAASTIETMNGYYGSIFGATVTIVAVILTFRHERKMTDEQNRLQLMPRFNVTKIIRKELFPDHPIWTEEITVNSFDQKSGDGFGRIGYCFQNVGLANAVGVTIRIYLSKEKIYAVIHDAILKDDSIKIIFRAKYATSNSISFDEKSKDDGADLYGYKHTIELIYTDLRNNKYRQTIDALFVIQEEEVNQIKSKSIHLQIKNINVPELIP